MADQSASLAKFLLVDPASLDGEGERVRAACPHPEHVGDGDTNFSVRASQNGKYWTLECHSHGCDLRDVLKSAGISASQSQHSKAQFLVYRKPKGERGTLDTSYPYVDEDGEVLYYVDRYRDPKGFGQRLADGSPRLGNVRRVLYHLPSVLEAASRGETVYVVEGEKDADRLREQENVMATTCAQGAGKWQDAFSRSLRGAHVVIVADRDEKGYQHARAVALSVRPHAASVRTVHTPIKRDKADVSDHLDDGLPLSALESIDKVVTAEELVGRDGIYALKVMQAVEDIGPIAKAKSGQLYAYEGGYWQLCIRGGELIRGRVAHLLGDKYRTFHGNTAKDMFQVRPAQFDDDKPDTRYINVANGLLDWRTGELHPHTPDVFTTSQLPVEWNPDAECPRIDAWLRSTIPADAIDLAYEIAGYALYNDNPLHKAVLLFATGRNGKGTFLRLLNALIGDENVSQVTPQQLDDNRFRAAELHGKLANLAGDVNAKIFKATEIFKQVTGGDRLVVERKHEQPFSFTCRALMVASFNEFPKTSDTTEGFFSRWVVLPFQGYFPEGVADHGLDAKLHTEEELQGFLSKAVQGLQRLMTRGRFAVPASVQEATGKFREAADPVRRFIAEHVVWDVDGWVTRRDLYGAYKTWCSEEGFQPMASSRFYGDVESAAASGGHSLRPSQRREAGTKVRGFVGLRTALDAIAEQDSDAGTPTPVRPLSIVPTDGPSLDDVI